MKFWLDTCLELQTRRAQGLDLGLARGPQFPPEEVSRAPVFLFVSWPCRGCFAGRPPSRCPKAFHLPDLRRPSRNWGGFVPNPIDSSKQKASSRPNQTLHPCRPLKASWEPCEAPGREAPGGGGGRSASEKNDFEVCAVWGNAF